MEDTDLKWRKASYSSNGGGNCVEVGKARRGVLVRDTKQNGTARCCGSARPHGADSPIG